MVGCKRVKPGASHPVLRPAHCQCRIIGHGIESDGTFFCCAACAKHMGVSGAQDRV